MLLFPTLILQCPVWGGGKTLILLGWGAQHFVHTLTFRASACYYVSKLGGGVNYCADNANNRGGGFKIILEHFLIVKTFLAIRNHYYFHAHVIYLKTIRLVNLLQLSEFASWHNAKFFHSWPWYSEWILPFLSASQFGNIWVGTSRFSAKMIIQVGA